MFLQFVMDHFTKGKIMKTEIYLDDLGDEKNEVCLCSHKDPSRVVIWIGKQIECEVNIAELRVALRKIAVKEERLC